MTHAQWLDQANILSSEESFSAESDFAAAAIRDDATEPCDPATTHARNAQIARWYAEWRDPMRRFLAHRTHIQSADLDDVAQDVFMRIMRYSRNAEVTYPQSYLFRIAVNVVNEWRERARNSRPHDESFLNELLIESSEEPENTVDQMTVDQRVREAVLRLPQRQRTFLILHIQEGLTYKEIAARIKCSHRVVRRDIARAYSDLRLELEPVLRRRAQMKASSHKRTACELHASS